MDSSGQVESVCLRKVTPKKDGRKCPRKPRFQQGDRVLCFHGPFLYKAECTSVSVKYRKVKYQVRYFGVKERSLIKSQVAKQLSNPQAPDVCEPSTSEARDSVVLNDVDEWDACVALRGRPSPQADWEDEWLPQSKLLKYNKANLRKLRELNRAKQGEAAERTGAGPVTREKSSSLQRTDDEASAGTMQNKVKTVRRQIIRIAETPSTSIRSGRGRGRPPGSGRGRPPGSGRGRPPGSGRGRPPGSGRGRPPGSGRGRPPGSGRGRPPGSGRGRPPGSGRGRPPGSGRGRPPGHRRKSLLLPRKKRAPVTYAAYSDSSGSEHPQSLLENAEIKVCIPEVLKPWLWDDWDMIVKQDQLFHLPANKNVDSILEDYEHYERVSGNADAKWLRDVRDFVEGIKAYFNVLLGSQLLYKFERPQYADILENMPGVPLSQVYGAPHLLRLFVKAEEMLTSTPLEEQSLALLLQHLHHFLDYLADHFSVLFNSNEYECATPEYYRRTL